jgi:hypothetical protein
VVTHPTATTVLPGQVIRIVYAGYKILAPDGTESILNPDNSTFEEIILNTGEDIANHAEYHTAVTRFQQQLDELRQMEQKKIQQEQERKALQSQCLHRGDLVEEETRSPGCDVYEAHCAICGKFLRRSLSTNADRDPDDDIGDWDWWVYYYQKKYNATPDRKDYCLV